MIEDTSAHDPRVHLAGMDVEGLSSYVEGMESEGQQQVVSSNQLPRHAKPDWDVFEALGIQRGEDVGGVDGLFCIASLPEGWTRKAHENPIWSSLVDARGLERVAIYYKAAFYSRAAFMRLVESPGYVLAGDLINNSNLADLPPRWDLLTAAERCDFRRGLEELRTFIEKFPHEDRGRRARVERIIGLIDEVQG